MTISSTSAIVTYTGDAVTTDFAVPFEFYLGSDIRVRHYADPEDRDTYVEYQFGTDYLVTGGDGAPGTVLIQIAAPPDQSEVEIVSFMSFGQAVAYGPHDPFPAESHETALDRLAIQIKQIAAFVPGAGGGGTPGTVTSVFGRSGDIDALGSDYAAFYKDIGYTPTWAEITGKPATFPPETHFHDWADITGKPATFPPSAHTHTWGEITGKPPTYTPGGTVVGAVQYREGSSSTGGEDLLRAARSIAGDISGGVLDFYATDGVDMEQIGAVGLDVSYNVMAMAAIGATPIALVGNVAHIVTNNLNEGDPLVMGSNGLLITQPQSNPSLLEKDEVTGADITLSGVPQDLGVSITTTREITENSGNASFSFFVTKAGGQLYGVEVRAVLDGVPSASPIQFDNLVGTTLISYDQTFVASAPVGSVLTLEATATWTGPAPIIERDVEPVKLTLLHFGTNEISFLGDLLDVNVPAPSDGFSLVWVEAAQEWQAIDVGGGGGGAVDSVFGRSGNVVAVGTDYAAFYKDISYVPDWAELTNVPSTFPPDAHTHVIDDVTGLQAALDAKAAVSHTHDWTTDITGKPSTFPPEPHTHTADEVTDLATVIQGRDSIWIPAIELDKYTGDGMALQGPLGQAYWELPAGANSMLIGTVRMPKSWDLAQVVVQAIFATTDTVGTGSIRFGMYQRAINDGEQFSQDQGSGAGDTVAMGATTWERASSLQIGSTLQGTPAEGSVIQFYPQRNVDHAEDTYTESVALVGVLFTYDRNAYNDT